jgi:hypothetical protein
MMMINAAVLKGNTFNASPTRDQARAAGTKYAETSMRRGTSLPTGSSAARVAAELAPQGEYALEYPFTPASIKATVAIATALPVVAKPSPRPTPTAQIGTTLPRRDSDAGPIMPFECST